MWKEAVLDFHERYFEMPTVHKLLLSRELSFDFEEEVPDERKLACLNTIFSRIEDILNFIVADVGTEEFINIPNGDVFRAFVSESGKWCGEGGIYGRFEMLVLSNRIANM